jgi:two-component system, OmpR family, response regulator
MSNLNAVERSGLRLVKATKDRGRSLRVLLIEDHADSAEAMIAIMDRRNHRVQWAGTGAAALALLDRASPPALPDVIILDLMLPDMSGVEVIQELRRGRGATLPPVVVLSAKPLATIRAEAQAIGASGFLRKPFSIDDLLHAVESAVPPSHTV